MFVIAMVNQFVGIPTNEELTAAIEQTPQRVAPYAQLNMPIFVRFVFDMFLFAAPSQAEVQDLSERLKFVFESKMADEKPQSYQMLGFMVTAQLVQTAAADLSSMN